MNKKYSKKAITKRSEDYSQWYLDVIAAADLAENSPVRGCMTIKPKGYAIWEKMQNYLDAQFKLTGVENAYFPLFIPKSFLVKEEEHVEGFAPEVAEVTHVGGKRLEESLVVRPTSETIIYETFSQWIQSYRDLPLLINQWSNVVRWEKRTRLFLRTTEFLWQEGHTVHATQEEADKRARQMLNVYKKFAEDILAIPVISGQKSESEKFAGALHTYTIEAMMQDGKALQLGTSHNLGQNFAKAFGVQFLDQDEKYKFGWQTSWGITTRTIGALIMTHGDDNGLIVPPKIAPIHVVIIPIINESNRDEILQVARKLKTALADADISTHLDESTDRPGSKFFTWERRGIPIRIEIGPRDIEKQSVTIVRRDNNEKCVYEMKGVENNIEKLLGDIQDSLFQRALAYQNKKTQVVNSWEEFTQAIDNNCFALAHWDGTKETEEKIKKLTKATIRCIPFSQEPENDGTCVYTKKPSVQRVLFARAY